MKILITGANGFVGRSLCKALSDAGISVREAVRKRENASSSNGELISIGDLGPDTSWSNALNGVGVVIHLAARVHVMKDASLDSLSEYRRVNAEGTRQLAHVAAESGVRRLVYVSTIKVNGEQTNNIPFTESDEPNPQDAYAVSKWEAEQALRKIAAETGLEVVIIRPPLIYGPGVKANFLQMIEVVNRGIPLPLASINNRRSLIYLENLVDAIVTCVNHPKAAGQTYLVSDGEDVSTPELIRRVAAALGRPARLFPFPPSLMRFAGKLFGKSDAVERLVGLLTIDNSKIRRELGWKPPYTMEQGLKETAEWFKRRF